MATVRSSQLWGSCDLTQRRHTVTVRVSILLSPALQLGLFCLVPLASGNSHIHEYSVGVEGRGVGETVRSSNPD